MLIQTLDLQET